MVSAVVKGIVTVVVVMMTMMAMMIMIAMTLLLHCNHDNGYIRKK